MELSPPVPPERSDQRLTLFMSGHHKGFHLLNSNLLEEAESHLVAYPNLPCHLCSHSGLHHHPGFNPISLDRTPFLLTWGLTLIFHVPSQSPHHRKPLKTHYALCLLPGALAQLLCDHSPHLCPFPHPKLQQPYDGEAGVLSAYWVSPWDFVQGSVGVAERVGGMGSDRLNKSP